MCNVKNKTEARIVEVNRINNLIVSFFSMYNNILNSPLLDEVEKEIKSESIMNEINRYKDELDRLLS